MTNSEELLSEPLVLVTQRLHGEFPYVSPAKLVDLVETCRNQIDTGAPPDCIPELVERLARIRLHDRYDTATGSS
jgi:hypothetical protein